TGAGPLRPRPGLRRLLRTLRLGPPFIGVAPSWSGAAAPADLISVRPHRPSCSDYTDASVEPLSECCAPLGAQIHRSWPVGAALFVHSGRLEGWGDPSPAQGPPFAPTRRPMRGCNQSKGVRVGRQNPLTDALA